MRQSARLKASGSSSKLEEFLSEITEKEEHEEHSETYSNDFGKKSTDSTLEGTTKVKKIGRPRKQILKGVDEIEDYLSQSDTDSIISESESGSHLTKFPKKRSSKKKSKRSGNYLPPLETPYGIQNNLLSSRQDWDLFLNEQNSSIKRKNRRFKTVMLPHSRGIEVKGISQSLYDLLQNDHKIRKPPLEIVINDSKTSLTDEILQISGKLVLFNSGLQVNSIRFCDCYSCNNSESFTVLIVSFKRILIISSTASKKDGIKTLSEIGSLIPPESEIFKSVRIVDSIASISTDKGIYFLNCLLLHQTKVLISLKEATITVPETSSAITCHAWNGKYTAIGTQSGRIHIFNNEAQEIFQILIKANCSIYSLDWQDECTILIGGHFSKIFSIDLRDPLLIETEVSTLGLLPKVVWSQSLNSILFTDTENHGRRLEKSQDKFNKLHQPIGTFDSMIFDIASSKTHNILATACASGEIHLSWMASEFGNGLEFEKRIFAIRKEEHIEAIIEPQYVSFQAHDIIKLYPSNQACTAVSWCSNENFPGLLAGGYRNGLITLITTDRFFI